MPGPRTPKEFREQMKTGTLEPLYLVTGDDEAEMTALASELADSVEEELRAFNVQRFYGSDAGTTLAEVLDAAGTLPLLAPRRIVLLMQAQALLTGKKARAAEEQEAGDDETAGPGKASELSRLKEYAGRPYDHAVVALFGHGLQRSFTALARHAVVVTCEIGFDVVRDVEAAFGVRFDREAEELLRGTVGADVGRLRAEAERIALYATGRRTVTRELVREAMNHASAAENLWKLVANQRSADALRELRLELADGKKPGIYFMILGLLRSVVERAVASRDLPRALDALFRTDLALKTSGGDPQVLLERLVVELCATGRN